MTTKELIATEIKKIPEPLLVEVLDFIRFLEAKVLEKRMETAIISEASLKKDWLRPEEDEAWRNL